MILLLDHRDSFTYNIKALLDLCDQDCEIIDSITCNPEELIQRNYSHFILSPGPGSPFGGLGRNHPDWILLDSLENRIPILGICLGFQSILEWKGGVIQKDLHPVHGSSSKILHQGIGLFRGISSPMDGGRYHSLIADRKSIPNCFVLTAETEDQIPMGIMHKEKPIHGVQFHPDSILTPEGIQILKNFLDLPLN